MRALLQYLPTGLHQRLVASQKTAFKLLEVDSDGPDILRPELRSAHPRLAWYTMRRPTNQRLLPTSLPPLHGAKAAGEAGRFEGLVRGRQRAWALIFAMPALSETGRYGRPV